ncbi:hypothetical protein PMI09_01836 [Rhizobium sp. CF122]|nr:hypothetical protein PMI09_01836 [Rhizobium sp. CF122]
MDDVKGWLSSSFASGGGAAFGLLAPRRRSWRGAGAASGPNAEWQNAAGVRQVPGDQIRGSRPWATLRFSSRAMSSASLLLRPTKSLPSVAAGSDVKVSMIVHLPRNS